MRAGLLHAGDIIHEINGTAVRGFSVDQVAELMAGLRGTVVFKITPAISDLRPKRRTQVRGRMLPPGGRGLFPHTNLLAASHKIPQQSEA